jgi:hypothetical protein
MTREQQEAELERQAKEQFEKDKAANVQKQIEMEIERKENAKRKKIAGVLIEKEEKIQQYVASICSTLRLKGIQKVDDILILEDSIGIAYQSDRESLDVYWTLRKFLERMTARNKEKEDNKKNENLQKLMREADFIGRGKR